MPTLTEDVDEVIAVLGPKEELDFEDFCLALARVALAHGGGKVSGEPDPIRALLVVIASSDGFAQAQRTPSRKSLRDFSPLSPMAAIDSSNGNFGYKSALSSKPCAVIIGS